MSSYTLHIQYVDRPAETRTFTQAKVTLGRDIGDIVLHDTQVSGRHGEITFDNGTLRYTDVGSTNGSFLLQGQRVANIELTPGIALRLGNSLITVQVIDSPNVAGKGRTVIAGPGMAPGFPAPMRPPGPGAPAGAGGLAAPAGAIPRPGMPSPGMPSPGMPAAPPGGFAFANTAQMQSPAMPAGMPAAPSPASGSFVPQPATTPAPAFAVPAPMTPAPFGSPTTQPPQPVPPGPPPGGFSNISPGPGGYPVPQAPGMSQAPGVPQAPGMPQAPGAPPAPYGGGLSEVPPGAVSLAPPVSPRVAMDGTPAGVDGKTDLVGAVKAALQGGWSVLAPVAPLTVGMFIAVMVPVSVLTWLFAVILPTGLAALLGTILSLLQLAALLLLIPSAYRYVLANYLGQPITPQAAVAEVRARLVDVLVNMLVPSIVLGIFAGPIYWIEGKKLGDAIGRNFNLIGRDVVTIIVTWLALVVPITVAVVILGIVLGLLGSLGVLLTLLIANLLNAVMIAFTLGLSTWFYFNIRRRFEGGDPEAEARARLGAALPES